MTKIVIENNDAFLKAVEDLAKKEALYGRRSEASLTAFEGPVSRETLMALDVMMGRKENVQKYLEMGADPNFKTKGRALLDLARAYGYTDIAELLKQYGARPAYKGPKFR